MKDPESQSQNLGGFSRNASNFISYLAARLCPTSPPWLPPWGLILESLSGRHTNPIGASLSLHWWRSPSGRPPGVADSVWELCGVGVLCCVVSDRNSVNSKNTHYSVSFPLLVRKCGQQLGCYMWFCRRCALNVWNMPSPRGRAFSRAGRVRICLHSGAWDITWISNLKPLMQFWSSKERQTTLVPSALKVLGALIFSASGSSQRVGTQTTLRMS